MAKLSHLEKEYIKANYKNKSIDELTKKLEKDRELIEEYINNLQNAQKNNAKNNKKEKALESNISSINNVTSTLLSSDIKNNYKDMMNTLNYVILILIVCAAALAFVVLYNLASVNISERRRELATIKVLGFYNDEVTKYIYKEMFILTIIGSLLGLILGSFLTLYVIKICETNLFMFTFNINFISYLLSFIITLLFLFIVNLFMHFELKKLDMVEALKSYE